MSEANAARPAHFDRRKRVGFTYLPGTVAAGANRWPADELGTISGTAGGSFFADDAGTLLGGTRFFIRGACRIRIIGGAESLVVNANNPATPVARYDFTGAGTARQVDALQYPTCRPEFFAGFSVNRLTGVAPADDLYLFWTAFGVRK